MVKKTNHIKEFLILDKTEGFIVDTLSQKGEGLSVTKISESIKLARTSIYNSLEKLIGNKIIEKRGFLYSLIDDKMKKYEPALTDPIKAIADCMNEITLLKKGDVIYSIESDNEISELFKNRKDFLNWQRKVVKRGIIFKGVGSNQALDSFRLKLDDGLVKIINERSGSSRFTDSPLHGHCTIVVFENSVVFFSRVKKYFYRIDDEYVSGFIKTIVGVFDDVLKFERIV
jgi:predicted transcriptional regulator